jgi:hypothetical protein
VRLIAEFHRRERKPPVLEAGKVIDQRYGVAGVGEVLDRVGHLDRQAFRLVRKVHAGAGLLYLNRFYFHSFSTTEDTEHTEVYVLFSPCSWCSQWFNVFFTFLTTEITEVTEILHRSLFSVALGALCGPISSFFSHHGGHGEHRERINFLRALGVLCGSAPVV